MTQLQWQRLSTMLDDACADFLKERAPYRTLRSAQRIVQEKRSQLFLSTHLERKTGKDRRRKVA
jgi:hypothetical protein